MYSDEFCQACTIASFAFFFERIKALGNLLSLLFGKVNSFIM